MADKRALPSHDRHVHMSHVREHLQRAARHAAVIHGRDVEMHPATGGPPNRSAAPSSPRPHAPGDGAPSSTPGRA